MLALLDADFLLYRVGFASEQDDEKLAVSRLVETFTDIVFFEAKCDSYKGFISGKGNFRYDIAVTLPYKGNRKAPKPKHYDALRQQLIKLGCEEAEGQEADDSVSISAYSMNVEDYTVIKVDKDLDMIRGKHYNPVTKEFKYITEEEAIKHFYHQLLTGDKSTDNIPGLPKVGKVKATKILEGVEGEENLYHTVREVYLDKGFDDKYLLEQARLLWLRRQPNQLWEPPNDTKEV